jgi:hypothetical protein
MSGERAGARSRGSPLLAGAAIDPLRRRNPHRCRHAQRHGRPPPRTSGALPRSPADDFEAVVGKKRKRWTKWRARPPPKRKTDRHAFRPEGYSESVRRHLPVVASGLNDTAQPASRYPIAGQRGRNHGFYIKDEANRLILPACLASRGIPASIIAGNKLMCRLRR